LIEQIALASLLVAGLKLDKNLYYILPPRINIVGNSACQNITKINALALVDR
jgi:hypothetical protein